MFHAYIHGTLWKSSEHSPLVLLREMMVMMDSRISAVDRGEVFTGEIIFEQSGFRQVIAKLDLHRAPARGFHV